MSIRHIIILASVLLAACKTPAGTFEPACEAFAGDRITLRQSGFIWEKFTDVRQVDDDGNLIAPFPGFPKQGRVDRQGAELNMIATDGAVLPTMWLHETDGQVFLLTEQQRAELEGGQPMDECALKLRESA